jgi:hypothetical protein
MMEEWAEIRRLHRSEGMAIKAIARRLGLARNTVRAALAADAPPRYERAPAGSRADAFEPAIRALLAQFPEMPATVIAERIGWEHAPSVLRARSGKGISAGRAGRLSPRHRDLRLSRAWLRPGSGQSYAGPCLVRAASRVSERAVR